MPSQIIELLYQKDYASVFIPEIKRYTNTILKITNIPDNINVNEILYNPEIVQWFRNLPFRQSITFNLCFENEDEIDVNYENDELLEIFYTWPLSKLELLKDYVSINF
jgi:hypothetical protein